MPESSLTSAIAPIHFTPLYQERVWGGRNLESRYQRSLPKPAQPIGEAWELVDREDAQSVVSKGKWKGCTLHELWKTRRGEVFGNFDHISGRFPILIKILDACDDLSIQVHPPASVAAELGGEPKTEIWFIADAKPDAKLYVGVKPGTDRTKFRKAIDEGNVERLVHALKPAVGESIFIESGRLHAIGAGLLIHEIQQNSDTTYRVYDWDRTGLDGRPRELHIEQSLACIDFTDTNPRMTRESVAILADCPHFKAMRVDHAEAELWHPATADACMIASIIEGTYRDCDGHAWKRGDTLLMPRGGAPLVALSAARALAISLADSSTS